MGNPLSDQDKIQLPAELSGRTYDLPFLFILDHKKPVVNTKG